MRAGILGAWILGSGSLHAQVTFEDIKNSPSENWLLYAGDYAAQRHSPLEQINRGTVDSLVAKWVHHIKGSNKLTSIPLVFEGIMYVSNNNEVYALDAVSGRTVWHYRQLGVEMDRVNRGVGILGDRVFFVTSDCHLVALHRLTGGVLWDHQYADPKDGYHCTVSPVPVKDSIIVGVSGGDSGIRGYMTAHSPSTGEELWRLWTIPGEGEPGSETWCPPLPRGEPGSETRCPPLPWGGAGTWMSGTYDPELDVLYWTTGNPWPDFYGGDRPGDNLYTDSLLAIDPDTGKMKWYFQFTPHDVWDWDAQEFPILLDLPFEGKQRKLVVQANRNGYYYVLDRTTGEFLLGTPFVDKLTWSSGLDKNGRPILIEGTEPNLEGVEVCPTVRGASNFMAPSFNPDTGLLYVVVLEGCDVYTSSEKEPIPKTNFAGTGGERPPNDNNQFFIRALQPTTGERVWEYPMTGPTTMWAGTVSTAGGLVFFADDDNHLVALDAKSGKHLWHFNLGQPLYSSPITYSVNGKQYVTIVAQTDVFTFGLFEAAKPVPLVGELGSP